MLATISKTSTDDSKADDEKAVLYVYKSEAEVYLHPMEI